jgi:organic radical activating enzyme
MIHLRSLEFHAAHACNLYCAQCSHYSNLHTGGIVSVSEARENFDAWAGRLQPRKFAILGGEPTLNPDLCEILVLGRFAFRGARKLLVSNGFFLDRHPKLPKVLCENYYKLEISQHGNDPTYLEKFAAVLETVAKYRRDFPQLVIGIRQSHLGWRRQYRVEDGKALPILSRPRDGWRACIQKHCTQLYRRHLWKCPALTYFGLMQRKLRLESIPDWQLFRDYQACPPTASDDEVRRFLASEEIPQCGLCPDRKIPFQHADPTTSGVA